MNKWIIGIVLFFIALEDPVSAGGCEGIFNQSNQGKNVTKELDRIEAFLPRNSQEMTEAIQNQDVGLSLTRFVERARQQAAEVRKLANELQDPTKKNAVLELADLMDIKPGSRKSNKFQKLLEEFRGTTLPSPPWHREQWSHLDRILRVLDGIVGQNRGTLGELKVALSVNGLVSIQRRVKEIVSKIDPSLDLRRHLGELSVDLIFESGKAWGQVMNWAYVARPSDLNRKRVFRRLEEIQQVIRMLAEEGLPHPTQVHLFFLGGIPQSLARELEQKGAIVHGIIPS